MRPTAVEHRPLAISRRAFLRALLAALALRFQPFATRFTALADELARLTCWRTSAPRLAAG